MNNVDLFQSETYPVIQGAGKTTALCTVWNLPSGAPKGKNPGGIIEQNPGLLNSCAIIGSLYTRAGISAIIRNLSICSDIAKLYIWDHGPLSRNFAGRASVDILRALWKNGVKDNGEVIGTSYCFEPEIDPTHVRTIVSDIELIEVGDKEASALTEVIIDSTVCTQRKQRIFPEPKPVITNRWPSERTGWLVREQTIITAWQQLLMHIMRYGVEKESAYGMTREIVGFAWTVTNEDPDVFSAPSDWPNHLLATTGLEPKMLEDYLKTVIESGHGRASYGDRLRSYPKQDQALDQIADVLIKNFRTSHDSRRAVATTMIPAEDWDSKEPPCLIVIQNLQADAVMDMIAVFRSHDIYKAAPMNAYALRKMQKMIAIELGFGQGELTILSNSAHIYKPDWRNAKLMIDCLANRKPTIGPAANNYDPRGNFIISVGPEGITCVLRAPNGAELWKMQNPSAERIMAKIAQLRLIIDPYHLMYVGGELMRAENRLVTGQKFVQR